MKIKNISKNVKSFLFKLLPNVVQQFYIWKYELNKDTFKTDFDSFLSMHLNRRYKHLFAIINFDDNKNITCYNSQVCLFSNIDKAIKYYVKSGMYEYNCYKICEIDVSTNIIKIHR